MRRARASGGGAAGGVSDELASEGEHRSISDQPLLTLPGRRQCERVRVHMVRAAFCGISHETNTFVTSALGLTPRGPGTCSCSTNLFVRLTTS